MHLYSIPIGTTGKLIEQCDSVVITEWVTRKDLTFTECVVDPIVYHNTRGNSTVPDFLNKLAEKGYAVYGGTSGGDSGATYLLAVPYNEVQVS